jgi:predicted DNA-binding protein (UPF0251 family)
MPWNVSFGPTGDRAAESTVVMSVDEYETIRLIDLMGFTQEECAAQMNVARTTVQGIYNDARNKLADVLVNGKGLAIRGGDYAICDGREEACACEGCCKHRGEENR